MAAAAIQRGSSGSRSSSSSSSINTCTRLVPGPVITVSPSHTLDYDCTDCGSFLFGSRGRLRHRPHGARNSSSHHYSRGNNISEPVQTDAQRLLLVESTPVHDPFSTAVSQHMILPQNEQLAVFAQATEPEDTVDYIQATGLSTEVIEAVSLQASDNEVEEVGNQRAIDFVACHGSTPAFADNVNDSSSTLAEIFRCFICLGKVVDAQLCPCCSKLVCQPCIKRWLTDQKSECPHCRAPLLVTQLVSCRFISEISLEVEKIQGKLGDSPMVKYCPTHDSPLLYFCTTCSVAVCSDCAVLIEDHRNHTFEKLSVAYGRHKKKIRMEAAGLRRRRKELCALVASVEKNIETVLKSKDESAAELQMAFKRMQSRLEEQLKCKLLALLAQKGSMTQEMELLDTVLHELDQQLNSIPKSDLIAQEPNMSRMLQDIRTRNFSDISRTPIPPEFISEVIPSYEYGELILNNYKEDLTQTRPTVFTTGCTLNSAEALSSRDVVYSEPICGSGVIWRLKVYPNGSGASQGTHLSVFLEMVDGGNEPATYEYGIELLHRTRPNQRIVRKFSSDFEAGACWGYYQFFRIDLLEKEGYILPDEDTITLCFYVRPLTYQQQCQDLRRSLAALQVERDESAAQVAVIRRAFAAAFFQRRRRRGSRTAGHVTNEQIAFAQAVAAGTGTSNASPTLSVRKAPQIPSIKHVQMKMQECNGSRVEKSWNNGILPQFEGHHHSECTVEINSEVVSQVVAADSPVRMHASSLTRHEKPSTEELSKEFLTHPEDGDVPANLDQNDDDGTGTPSIEHIVTHKSQGKNHQEILSKKGDDIFQIPKVCSHKKLRSRKAHKVLIPPEALLPFTEIPRSAEIARHLTGLSMVEAGPSMKQSGNPAAPGGCSESSKDEKYGDGAYSDPGCQRVLAGPAIASVVVGGLINDEVGDDKCPYYSAMSGSSNNLCTPEIEDWGNLK
ncbi:uncharacterized protein [Physcomitrium patens]|uniref:uncharacterized protein isoform X2 n=1 Tax=Physcomitrium patens TaxID=3218 RepID=UPI000D1633CC|nr:uncharacterized protein LOC112290177 isoform X2 [Physcomitrium patens]|eukprot:XP_024391968.1 uncharacterized protein LOC112290177 isoform X2 [Physcomitrella patens]